jgi:predicted phosphoribosyltransferase
MIDSGVFRDRADAGRLLASTLEGQRLERPVVLGMARGGVPVAAEVARRLAAPLDVLVVRKLGAPGQPEFAIGALAEGVTHIDESTVRMLGVPRDVLDRLVAAETAERERREVVYRKGRPPLDLAGRTVIVVDDGLATGASARAAIMSLRRRGPARIVFAAPVCAPESAAALRDVADAVVCVESPRDFRAVGHWYEDFSPTADAEVVTLLEEAAQTAPRP